MSDLMGKVKDAVGKHEDKQAQPGDGIEKKADDAVNQQVDNFASNEGVPQKFDGAINDVVDKKVNDEIPGGN